tara:strand:- start:1258 stop:1677 length:420 start_codon:yes stop_codon:yes gene_type:complete
MKKFLILILLLSLFLTSCYKNEPEKITIIKLAETTKSWNGDKLPNYLEGNAKVTILKITIPPNTKLETHKHLEINAGVLLKGELTVISEQNDTLYLKAGDPIVELVNTWHYGKNEGKIPAEIIVFYAGVEGTPITIIKD